MKLKKIYIYYIKRQQKNYSYLPKLNCQTHNLAHEIRITSQKENKNIYKANVNQLNVNGENHEKKTKKKIQPKPTHVSLLNL